MAGKALVTFESNTPKDLPPNFVKVDAKNNQFCVNDMTKEQLIAKFNEDDF